MAKKPHDPHAPPDPIATGAATLAEPAKKSTRSKSVRPKIAEEAIKAGLPKAPPAKEERKPVAPDRYQYECIVTIGGERFGPFSPKEGAVDPGEAKQRVLAENPNLRSFQHKGRWEVSRTSEDPLSGNSS